MAIEINLKKICKNRVMNCAEQANEGSQRKKHLKSTQKAPEKAQLCTKLGHA